MAARRTPRRTPDVIEQARAAAATDRRPLPSDSLAARYRDVARTLYPWERLDEETDTAWDLFVLWRDTPPHERTYAAIATKARRDGRRVRDPKAVAVFAQRYRWVERAREYDRHLDRVAVAETVESRRRLAANLTRVGDVAVALIAHELGRTLEAARAGAPIMAAADIARIAERFVPIAYRARDLPEHTVDVGAATVVLTPGGSSPVTDDETGPHARTGAGYVASAGMLSDDPEFRAVVLAAQARITAARQGPPAAIDVPAALVHPDEPAAGIAWDDVDADDLGDDDDEDPLVSMDESDTDDDGRA